MRKPTTTTLVSDPRHNTLVGQARRRMDRHCGSDLVLAASPVFCTSLSPHIIGFQGRGRDTREDLLHLSKGSVDIEDSSLLLRKVGRDGAMSDEQ